CPPAIVRPTSGDAAPPDVGCPFNSRPTGAVQRSAGWQIDHSGRTTNPSSPIPNHNQSRIPNTRLRSSSYGGQAESLSDLDFRGVLRGGDAFFDEGVPVVTVRALPQQLGAAVTAAHADVGIEIEHGVVGELAVAIHERLGVA